MAIEPQSLAGYAVAKATETPAGSAKLTLEALQHWRFRLARELEVLASDVESGERLSENWCGKCEEALVELLKEYVVKKGVEEPHCV